MANNNNNKTRAISEPVHSIYGHSTRGKEWPQTLTVVSPVCKRVMCRVIFIPFTQYKCKLSPMTAKINNDNDKTRYNGINSEWL